MDSDAHLQSNFSFRSPSRRLRRRPGELYVAGLLASSSRDTNELARLLAGYLASAAMPQDHLTTTKLRAFAHNGRVVLTDVPRPGLVADGLLPPGAVELAILHPRLDPKSAMLKVPEPLAHLRWRDAALSVPSDSPMSYPIVGMVVAFDDVAGAGLNAAWRASEGGLDEWRDLLGVLLREGRTREARTIIEYGEAVHELLQLRV